MLQTHQKCFVGICVIHFQALKVCSPLADRRKKARVELVAWRNGAWRHDTLNIVHRCTCAALYFPAAGPCGEKIKSMWTFHMQTPPQPFSARFAWHCFPLHQHFITCGWVPWKLNIILLCLEGGQRTFTKWRHEEDAFCLGGFGDFSSPSWRCSFGAKLCLPSGTDECAELS